VRFGLAGTGYWARATHAAVLASEPGVDFIAVWGRSADKAAALAGEFGAKPYPEFGEFLRHVDAVAFALPPDVQAALATRAADAGKHLLLDKPLATSVEAAGRLTSAADRAGVSSVVFFTARFTPVIREWLAEVRDVGWEGAWARWIVSAFGADSPYRSSSWRREKGALWDVGPHALSLLTGALGPVTGVTADAGAGDLVHLVLHHAAGATSTASLTLGAPRPAVHVELSLWGPAGVSPMPRKDDSPTVAYGVALRELVADAEAGRRSHPCDVRFGAAVVSVLADAEQQITARRAEVG
jgi:predicted dehydrogenase